MMAFNQGLYGRQDLIREDFSRHSLLIGLHAMELQQINKHDHQAQASIGAQRPTDRMGPRGGDADRSFSVAGGNGY
jgi:hypothetical protein